MMPKFLTTPLIAAAALAATFATSLPASEAQAGVDVSIGLGVGYPPVYAGGGYDGYGYGGYDGGYGHPGYHRPDYGYDDGYLSCRDGSRILYRYGYNAVRVASCRGAVYTYTAWRNGRQFLMRVSADGDVRRLRRIY